MATETVLAHGIAERVGQLMQLEMTWTRPRNWQPQHWGAYVGRDIGVKAAGGIRTPADALAMIDAGASRIGTSSTEKILAEFT